MSEEGPSSLFTIRSPLRQNLIPSVTGTAPLLNSPPDSKNRCDLASAKSRIPATSSSKPPPVLAPSDVRDTRYDTVAQSGLFGQETSCSSLKQSAIGP